MKEIVIKDKDAGQRLDKFCFRILDKAPKSFIYKMLRKKNIVLNDKKAEGNEQLKNSDSVKFYLSDDTFNSFTSINDSSNNTAHSSIPALDPKRVVYEDDNILVAFKVVGELSQKVNPDDISINEKIVSYLKSKNYEESIGFTPGVVNRLDRNTCGLIVCGKNLRAQSELSKMFKDRTIDKYYLAIVKGQLKDKIDATLYLSKDEKNNLVKVSAEPFMDSCLTKSVFSPISTNGRYTLVRVKLETGKSHQIRAQLAYYGYPIVGDPKYGDKETNRIAVEKYKIKSQLLLAHEIIFPELSGLLENLSHKSIKTRLPKEYGDFLKEEGLCHRGIQED